MARAETIRTERRRRDTAQLSGQRRKLSLTGNLDTENFSHRWVNDEGTRIHEMTAEDWDIYEDRDNKLRPDTADMGAKVAVYAGTDERGQAVRTVLMRKRKDWWQDDRAARQRYIDEIESGIKQGHAPGVAADHTYVPQGGIQIGRS